MLIPVGNPLIISDPQRCFKGSSTFSGNNCNIVFALHANPGNTFAFLSGHTYSKMSGAFLIRSTDKVAYLACASGSYSRCFTPEYIAQMQGLGHIAALRTMAMNFPAQAGGGNNEASWAYRTPRTALTYYVDNWFPDLWAGSASGVDQYTLGSYPSMPASWTDGEEFQANFPSSNGAVLKIRGASSNGGLVQLSLTGSTTAKLKQGQQILVASQAECPTYKLGTSGKPVVYAIDSIDDSTHFTLARTTYSSAWRCSSAIVSTTTIDAGGRGPKFVTDMNVLNGAIISSGANATLIYDGYLDVLLYAAGGIQSGVPKEIQAGLANALQAPLWMNIPQHYDLHSVSSMVVFLSGYLSKDLFLEYGNENWNFVFPAQWIQQRGMALGLPTSDFNALMSFAGLRARQMFANAKSTWSRDASLLHLVLAGASFAGTTASLWDTYEFKGSTLCGKSCGNPVYQSLVGTDYNVAPNRPIDLLGSAGGISYASYFHGPQIDGGQGTLKQLAGSCNGTTCTGIIAAATCFTSPSSLTCGTGGGKETALQFMYDDTYDGTFADGSGGAFSIEYVQKKASVAWNIVAASYPVSVFSYEGGYDAPGLNQSYLTSIGDTSASSCTPCNGAPTDATNIAKLLIAFKNSSLFYTAVETWDAQFFANSQSKYNSWLGITGPSQWSLLSTGFPPLYILQPYKSYNAISKLNGGVNFLLNRDLDPASNDSSPWGLNSAA
jgi:hypothetical protein